MSLATFAALACVLIGASHRLVSAAGAAESPKIFFKTSPRIELLRPFADPIDLSLLITGADGKPIQGGTVDIRLNAPKPGRFFSTDYPLVEGTLLNEMRLPLRQGRAAWKYLFPIRGEYHLAVDFTSDDGAKASQVFNFRVSERREKLWALAGFSLALLALGFAAGRIFTGRAISGVFSAGVLWAASITHSHGPAENAPQSPGLAIEPATVGSPTVVRWSKTGDGSGSNVLSLSIVHLEKEKMVFAIDKISVPDEWSMKFHFPDGGGYRVNAVAESSAQPPIRTEQVIAVTGAEPPAGAAVPALVYFVGLIAVGLGLGRWSKRRRTQA